MTNQIIDIKKNCFFVGAEVPGKRGGISSMLSAGAAGVLPPYYVVYRAECTWTSSLEGDQPGTFYRRAKTFKEWLMEIVAFWEKRDSIRKGGIGDNPSSHTNREVVKILLQPTCVKPRDKVEKRLKKLRSFEQINTHSEGALSKSWPSITPYQRIHGKLFREGVDAS